MAMLAEMVADVCNHSHLAHSTKCDHSCPSPYWDELQCFENAKISRLY